jgi:hypothetical protein
MAEGDLMGLLPAVIGAAKAALYVSKIAPFATVLLMEIAFSSGFWGRSRN